MTTYTEIVEGVANDGEESHEEDNHGDQRYSYS